MVSFGDEGWATYAWYTYKGNAPEKMWIRVDLNTSILPWDQGYGAGPGDITNFWTKYRFEGYKPGSWRWTVVIGEDTPMATAVNKNQIRIYCEEGDPCYAELRGYGGNIYTRAQRRREWTDAPAAELVAREAADWIDLAYEGSA